MLAGIKSKLSFANTHATLIACKYWAVVLNISFFMILLVKDKVQLYCIETILYFCQTNKTKSCTEQHVFIKIVGTNGSQRVEYSNIMRLTYRGNEKFRELIQISNLHRKIKREVQQPRHREGGVMGLGRKTQTAEQVHLQQQLTRA